MLSSARRPSNRVVCAAADGGRYGLQRPTKRNRLWSSVESAVLRGLADRSTEVRFWACYAAGTLQVQSALPKLEELANTDSEICPNWWRVSEEAADAIEWIHGRETASRLPMSRGSKHKSSKDEGKAQQSLAADGAIACFSSDLIPSARMLIARRS